VQPFQAGCTSAFNGTFVKAFINTLTTSCRLTRIRLRLKLEQNKNSVANYLSLSSGNTAAIVAPQLTAE